MNIKGRSRASTYHPLHYFRLNFIPKCDLVNPSLS
jgi:hypothetical protein